MRNLRVKHTKGVNRTYNGNFYIFKEITLLLFFFNGVYFKSWCVFGSNKSIIEEQKHLIESLSKITLKDKDSDRKKVMEYLQISEHNKSDIVTIWLKQKKNSFSDYILSRIVVDPDLPIYSSNTIIGTRNYANDTINSINKAYEISKKDWLTSYRDSFLNAVLNSKSKRRFEDGEKEFLKFFNKKYEKSLFNH